MMTLSVNDRISYKGEKATVKQVWKKKVKVILSDLNLYGGAVDIRPVNPGSLGKFQAWLDQHWYGALGYGAFRGFVHLDMRNRKGWRSSGQKGPRWNY